MLQFWIKDQYYFSNENAESVPLGKASRYYLLSDNHPVYSADGKLQELYKHALGEVCYVLKPVADCEVIFGYFMVYRKNLYDSRDFDLFLNGKLVTRGIPSYLQLWVLSNFRFNNNPEIVGYEDTATMPLEKFVANKRTFSQYISLEKKKIALSKNLIAHTATPEGGINKIKQQIKQQIEKNEQSVKTDTTRDYRPVPHWGLSLPANFTKRKYDASEKRAIEKVNTHIGQRKLLMSEIDFFLRMQCFAAPTLVLYAGAAPGQHIPILSDMFPLARFVLFDPEFGGHGRQKSRKKSCKEHYEVKPDAKIMVRSQLFDENVIVEFSKEQDMVLISDIRTTPGRKSEPNYESQFEERTEADMRLQESWVKQLSLRGALLKFRLRHVSLVKPPNDDLKTRYLAGEMRLQVWPKAITSERRLIVIPSLKLEDVEYGNKEEDEMMNSFNVDYRPRPFFSVHPLFGVNYDTQSEYKILNAWAQISGFPYEGENGDITAVLLMATIDCALGRGIGRLIIPGLFKVKKEKVQKPTSRLQDVRRPTLPPPEIKQRQRSTNPFA